MDPRLAYALLLNLGLGLTFLNLPPVLDQLMALYGVSYAGMAVLLSALLWTHALIQVPGGIILDRLGLRPSLYLSLGCLAAGNLLPALQAGLALAVFGRALAGLGTGIGFLAGLKLLATCAPPAKVGAYQGYYGGFFSLGSILAYLILPWLGPLSWRWPFLLAGLFALASLAWTPRLVLPAAAAAPSRPLPLARIARLPVAWVIGCYHALSYGSMINLGNWLPSVLAEARGLVSAEGLAWGGALVLLVSGVARICGGMILLRVPAVRVANGSILILGGAYAALWLAGLAGSTLLLVPFSLVAACFASVTFGAFFSVAGRAVPPASIGSVLGFVNLWANVGAVLFTVMFGGMKDAAGSFAHGFAVLAALAFMAVARGRKVVARDLRG